MPVKIKKPFLLFLASQGISSLGDTFRIVAVTILLVNLTGSGLSAAFGLVCYPVVSILLSPFAGSLGDKFSEKYILVILDALRGVIVILFIGVDSVLKIYLLVLILSVIDTLYTPPARKLMANLLHEKRIVVGNSLMSGVCGSAFIFGPVLAGIFVNVYGIDKAFYIYSLTSFSSSLLISLIKTKHGYSRAPVLKKQSGDMLEFFKDGLTYFSKEIRIRDIVVIATVINFGTAAINIAFYPFAFNILGVTSEQWGILLSIYYGVSLISMPISIIFSSDLNNAAMSFIYFPLIIVSGAWIFYSFTENLNLIMLAQGIEGIAMSICGIFLSTRLQAVTNKTLMARVMGINSIMNNAGRLVGIGFAYLLLQFSSPSTVFFINALIMAAYIAYRVLIPNTITQNSLHHYRS